MFQSLSGLSLGLNLGVVGCFSNPLGLVSIPFRAVTGFERAALERMGILYLFRFNPFQGCHWV